MSSDTGNTKKSTVKITVSGMVQGVGFRYYIARAAANYDINGYVKNLFSGEVEIYAEGRKEFLEYLANKAKSGPSHSRVENIQIQWLDFQNKYNKFEIR